MLRSMVTISTLALLALATGSADAKTQPPLWQSPARAQRIQQISSQAQAVVAALDGEVEAPELFVSLTTARQCGDAELARLALELQSVVQTRSGNYLYALYQRLEAYDAGSARSWADYLARLGVAIGMSSGHFHSLAHLDPTAPTPTAPAPNVADASVARWIDNFTRATYSVGYRPFRRGSLSEVLHLTYEDGAVLDIDIRLISDNRDPAVSQSMGRAYIGHAGRIVPLRLSPDTTPRLWRAKYEVALAAMHQSNVAFEGFVAISVAGTFSSLPMGMVAPVVSPSAPASGMRRLRTARTGGARQASVASASVRTPGRPARVTTSSRAPAGPPAHSRIVRRPTRAALAARRPGASVAWPPGPPKGPKPGLHEANAATWRYQRYAYNAYRNGRKKSEILSFTTWRRRYFETTLRGGRPGRPGGKAHQNDVKRNNDPNGIEGVRVGDRFPDGVGRPGQVLTIRDRKIAPVGKNRVIVESDHTIRGGTMPDSAARAQMRDIRQAAPDDTLVVTDLANPDAAPLIYPPGTQPPPRGPLPQHQAPVVPYP